MKAFKLLLCDLALFDGEGAGAGSGDGMSASAAGMQQGDNTVLEGTPADTRADEGKTPSERTPEERRKAYNDLIKGEYKDFYTEDTQKMIDRRFKETKNLEKQLKEHEDIIGLMKQRYGVEDASQLQEAIMNDDGYWEQAAFEAGMSVDQYKAFSKLERENRALLEAQAQRQNEERVNRQLEQWFREAEDLSQKFNGFDLETEIQNDPRFVQMLKAGVPMEHAFKVIHMDELMNNAIVTSAVEAERRTVDNIRARGQRPPENGTSSQSSFTVKDDVNNLSKADRAELVKRAARGEIISF